MDHGQRHPQRHPRWAPFEVRDAQRRFFALLAQGINIYDPATARSEGGFVTRSPFPGNIIPQARLNPVARAVMGYYPLPNQAGDAQGRNNFFAINPRSDDFYSVSTRTDHRLTPKQRRAPSATTRYVAATTCGSIGNSGRSRDAPQANMISGPTTRASATIPGALFGQDIASFMLGIPTGGSLDRNASRLNDTWYHGVFLQDDWKVTDRLTVNLGLRYEYEGATTDAQNRNVRGFDPAAAVSIDAAARAAYARSPIPEVGLASCAVRCGLQFASDSHPGFYDPDKNNIQPRVGFAFSLTDTIVVRGGWGVYAVPNIIFGNFQPGFSASQAIVPTLDNGLTFRANLINPFPDGVQEPVGATLGANTFLGRSLERVRADRLQQRAQHALYRSVQFIGQMQTGRPISFHDRNIYFGGDLNSLKTNYSGDTSQPVFDTSGFFFNDAAVQTNGVADPAKQRLDQRIRLANNLRYFPSRVPGLRGHGLNLWDISLVKQLRFGSRVRGQFHLEFLNATNMAVFNNPNTDPLNAQFGKVTSQANLPRDTQIAFKLIF